MVHPNIINAELEKTNFKFVGNSLVWSQLIVDNFHTVAD